ncbi:hypothetical protein [Methylobacterium sp. Leaf99]|uniref:hypothetical protein n=1 Tax=Methylobacterium sp. Leaf99 TaxID=1736251 RepID=UPI0012ED7044|nr:hypothetical protein [Methylobacterium sp. Leaf99]
MIDENGNTATKRTIFSTQEHIVEAQAAGVSLDGLFVIQALSSLGEKLALANLHHKSGSQRDAIMMSVSAVIEMLSALRAPHNELEPLVHLFHALGDLENGKIDPVLQAEKINNRTGETVSEWCARAYLSAALEARIKLGESILNSSTHISKEFDIVDDRSVSNKNAAKRLVDWRANFKSGKISFDDIHADYFRIMNDQISIANNLSGDTRIDMLNRLYVISMNEAKRYRNRTGKKPGG